MNTLSGKPTSSKLVLMFLPCLVVALLVVVQPARADNVTVFQMSGTFSDNSTVSGTLTIDLTDGMIAASNLSYLGQTYTDILTQGAFFGETEPGQTSMPVG